MLLFPSYTVFGFLGLLRGPTLIAEEFKRRFWQSRGQTTRQYSNYTILAQYYWNYTNQIEGIEEDRIPITYKMAVEITT